MKKIDILNAEWSSGGRDGHIIEPILVSLELLNPKIDIKRVDINFAFIALLIYRPKIIIISNGIGGEINLKLIKLAYKLGIKVITLNSEGDYINTKKSVSEFFWGWNKDKILYDDLQLVWSNRVKNYIQNYLVNEDKINISKIKTSGAVGFDRYNLLDFMSKDDFLFSIQKESYSKIITFAGFGFDWIIGDYYKRNPSIINDRFGKQYLPLHIKAQKELSEIYYQLVKTFTNILFIIKLHPATEENNLTEFSKIFNHLNEFNNVKIIKDEFSIDDVINISDIWIAYESTTCMEAWLLNKTTFLVNPCGKNFQRSQISEGSPIYDNFKIVKQKINEFYLNGYLKDFNILYEKRDKIYYDVIHSNDGLNHLRAVDFIIPFFKKKNDYHLNLNLNDVKYIFKRMVIRVISRFSKILILKEMKIVKDNINFYRIYNYNERKKLTIIYSDKLDRKYKKINLTINNYKSFLNND